MKVTRPISPFLYIMYRSIQMCPHRQLSGSLWYCKHYNLRMIFPRVDEGCEPDTSVKRLSSFRRAAKDPKYYCWWHSLLQAGNHARSYWIVFTLKVWAVAIRNSGFKDKNLEFFESILRLWSADLKPDGFSWSNRTCVDVLLWLANIKLLSNQRAWSFGYHNSHRSQWQTNKNMAWIHLNLNTTPRRKATRR